MTVGHEFIQLSLESLVTNGKTIVGIYDTTTKKIPTIIKCLNFNVVPVEVIIENVCIGIKPRSSRESHPNY